MNQSAPGGKFARAVPRRRTCRDRADSAARRRLGPCAE